MNDTEWIALRAQWHQRQALLPADLQRYARRQNLSLWVSNAIFWPLVLGEVAFAIWLLTHETRWPGRLDAKVILGFVALMSVWFVRSQRRLWRPALETPGEMLGRLERSLTRMRTAAWVGAGGFFGSTLFVLGQALVLNGSFASAWHASPGVVVNVAVGFAAVLLWPRFIARKARERQARIDAWRAQ